jgi:hypothetical protein
MLQVINETPLGRSQYNIQFTDGSVIRYTQINPSFNEPAYWTSSDATVEQNAALKLYSAMEVT